jgi:hypothetical protein
MSLPGGTTYFLIAGPLPLLGFGVAAGVDVETGFLGATVLDVGAAFDGAFCFSAMARNKAYVEA